MRRAIAVVFVLAGLATVISGVAIAFGDPYDVSRAGLLIISLFFIVPGLALLLGGLILIRRESKPREP